LLHVPTVGRNKLEPKDLQRPHLELVNAAILRGTAEHVFISAGVSLLMQASGAFPWLPKEASGLGPLRVLYREPSRSVYLHLHFSNYGKFQQQLEQEANAIASLIPAGA
jgi:hypothetical protein